MSLTVYALGLVAVWIQAGPLALEPHAFALMVVLGMVTTWQAGWGLVHLARALLFRQRRFPELRRAAARLDPSAARPGHLYVVFVTFGMRPETTARAFQSALDEAIRFGGPATVVAILLEEAEHWLIKQAFHAAAPPETLRLIFVRRPARDRRPALAAALRAIRRARPPDDAAVVVIGGDTLLPRTTFARSLAFFSLLPDVDLILTDERGIAGGLGGAWCALRRAERHQIMSSMASTGVLEPTDGGMVIFRTARLERFIELMESRPARSNGHDPPLACLEVIWLELLQTGRRMLYLPDVAVIRIGDRKNAFATTALQAASYDGRGLLSTPGRAVAPSGGQLAPFVRVRLLERTISALLPLLALLSTVGFALAQAAALAWVYLAWTATVRLVQTMVLMTARPRVHGLWPLLIEGHRIMVGWAVIAHLAARLLGQGSPLSPPPRATASPTSRPPHRTAPASRNP